MPLPWLPSPEVRPSLGFTLLIEAFEGWPIILGALLILVMFRKAVVVVSTGESMIIERIGQFARVIGPGTTSAEALLRH